MLTDTSTHHERRGLGQASAGGRTHSAAAVRGGPPPRSAAAVVVLALDDALGHVAVLGVFYVFLRVATGDAALVVAAGDPRLLEHLLPIPGRRV